MANYAECLLIGDCVIDYKPREIRFIEILDEIASWKLKVYFINNTCGALKEKYEIAKWLLPQWLKMENSFNRDHDSIGFFMVHMGNEGVFYSVNWWVGQNMLSGQVFFTSHERPNTFDQISGDGLIACVWEMEVINYERVSWTNHVLRATQPNFEKYLNDQLNGEF